MNPEEFQKPTMIRQTIDGANKYWKQLGPGLTTGAADDDPSGIATYSQVGAQYKFQFLWLAIFTLPLMATIQEMCARMALVTGKGLAGNIRQHYPKWVLYICTSLLFIANTFNLGADLGAMAKATELITPIPFTVSVILFALISLLLQIFTSYKTYAKYLKYLALILVSYVVTGFLIHVDIQEVFRHAVIPSISFSKEHIILLCAVLGTTISPYLFFWQTSQEIEEEILEGKTTPEELCITTDADVTSMRVDVWSGMFVSNIVMFFIIMVCGATLYTHGITNITTAADAATALKPLAGDWAFLLFALGIIGTGLLTVPILAGSTSYAIAESFDWKQGLYRKLKDAYAFYGVIIVSVIIGLLLNFIGLDPIKALIYSAVANGVIAPVILVLIVSMSSKESIMGKRKNKPFTSFVGWIVTILMLISGVASIIAFL